MRIENARSIHRPPTWEAPVGVRLRTRAAVALRQEASAFEERRRCLYEGVISRDQAARGAAIGQYVRMAIAQADERGDSDGAGAIEGTSAVLRRDLIRIMLRSMTGEDGGQERGRYVHDVV